MAINKKYVQKYSEYIAMLKKLRFDDHQISLKLEKMEGLEGWESITFNELKEMTQDELDKLLSYCWHDGNPRCDCIGIHDVKFENRPDYYEVTWSDSNGDPRVTTDSLDLDEKIDNVGNGDWNYGLYRKSK